MTLTGIKALAFDTGGTVLDWHRGVNRALAVGDRHGVTRDWAAITNAWRRRALRQMTNQKSPGFNIDDVHARTLDELVSEHDLSMISDDAERKIDCRTLARTGCLAGFSGCAGAVAQQPCRGLIHYPQRLIDH